MTSVTDPPQGSFRLSMLINDTRYRSYTFQFIALVLLIAFMAYLGMNLVRNLAAQGLNISFGFLSDPAGYDINQRPIEYDSQSSHLRAAMVGIINTLIVAFLAALTPQAQAQYFGRNKVRYDDFETDAGWTGGLPGDTALRGAWVRDVPIGTQAEPGGGFVAGNGRQCWFTAQQVFANVNDSDVDFGFTTLLSPVLDLTGLAYPTIEYERWFSNALGNNAPDDAFVVEISNDAGVTWTTLEVVGPLGPGTEGGWRQAAFLVTEFVVPTDQVQLRFIASDTGAPDLGAAALNV